jgi:hypothetical protein
MCRFSVNTGSLNILVPPASVQARTGVSLTLQHYHRGQHSSNNHQNFVHTVAVSSYTIRNWQFPENCNWKQKKDLHISHTRTMGLTQYSWGITVLVLVICEVRLQRRGKNGLLLRRNRLTNERVTLLANVSPHFEQLSAIARLIISTSAIWIDSEMLRVDAVYVWLNQKVYGVCFSICCFGCSSQCGPVD